MPYNSSIVRSEAQPLIPEVVTNQIIQGSVEESIVFRMGRRLANMPTNVTRQPVLDILPIAYFVSGDTGLKQTTEMQWSNKFLYAEELAVIVPIPENVIADTNYDLWGEIQPRLREAFGRAIDAAVLYGTNRPTNWPVGLLPAALAAAQVVDLSDTITAGGDLYDAILGENGVFALVENDGYEVNGQIGSLSMKAKMRGLRDANNVPIFTRVAGNSGVTGQDTAYELDGVPIYFPRNGAVDPAQSLLIAGDFAQLVYSFRSDITYKMITEGVITDNTGAIIFNLPQQDMVALRATMRLGWQVPNPINSVNSNSSTRYPFAALVP